MVQTTIITLVAGALALVVIVTATRRARKRAERQRVLARLKKYGWPLPEDTA